MGRRPTISTTHRCAEAACPYHGQPSPHSCACHQSGDHVAIDIATELLEVLLEARERMLGSSPAISALRARADSAIARAQGRAQ